MYLAYQLFNVNFQLPLQVQQSKYEAIRIAFFSLKSQDVPHSKP